MAAATLSVGVLLAILEAAPEIRVPFRVDSHPVASSEGNLKEAAVIETSRIAKVRSVSASLWIAPAGWASKHGSENTGMAERVKPRSREAVRPSRGALRATTVPVRMDADGEIRIRLFSRQDLLLISSLVARKMPGIVV